MFSSTIAGIFRKPPLAAMVLTCAIHRPSKGFHSPLIREEHA
jgi:hypothetical protein